MVGFVREGKKGDIVWHSIVILPLLALRVGQSGPLASESGGEGGPDLVSVVQKQVNF